jgi:hypothetical protein
MEIMQRTSSTPLPVWCAVLSAPNAAHPELVGLLAVQGGPRVGGEVSPVNGGVSLLNIGDLSKSGKSRTTTENQRLSGVYGTGVRADKGSLKPAAFAPASQTASGVPPRGRPV